MREKKNRTLATIMGVIVLFQVSLVILTAIGWRNPYFGRAWFGSLHLERLVVALVGSLFVGPSMMVIAYLKDFSRGYYIAVMMALAVFLMIYLNQPIYPIIIAAFIIIPGLLLFIQFLRKYPNPPTGDTNG